MSKFSVKSGAIEITSSNIVALREFVEDINNSIEGELPSYISDMFFSIEVMYQKYFELDEDDFSIHNELH